MGILIALLVLAPAAPVAAQAATGQIDITHLGYDRGEADAPITIVEFADFACSACGLFARETMAVIRKDWIATGKARNKYVPFILGIFPRAMDGARAGECAAEQDRFWAMHDVLYARQREWSGLGDARAKLEIYAREMGLDMTKFRACWEADTVRSRIDANTRAALSLRIRATPTLFINGGMITGAVLPDQMTQILESIYTGGR
jgi:protein-disulfide isomerase